MKQKLIVTDKRYCVIVFFIVLSANLFAQEIVNDDDKLHWWGDVPGFYNQQHKVSLQLVDEVLDKYPPSPVEPLERKMAMLLLDNVLHEDSAAIRPSVQDFLKRRISNSIGQLKETNVDKGALIWKLYNHGFVVRTNSVTIAFDLVPGNPWRGAGFQVDKEVFQELIDECDVLFISHHHGDHANVWVAQSFINDGKPVIAPQDVWNGRPIHDQITHLDRIADKSQTVKLRSGEKLDVINYPGHQGANIPNNLVVVTSPEGITFAHTGDQSGPEKEWEWIDKIGNQKHVDVLFPNCWTPDLPRMIKGVNPELVITGHENEMGHSIDHRESNWLSYTRLKESSRPFILMTWGEHYRYNNNQK